MNTRYFIVYDDSPDEYSARRYRVRSTARELSGRIRRIQERGHIIVSVERDAS